MVFVNSSSGLNPAGLQPPFQRSGASFVSQTNNTASLIAEGELKSNYSRRLLRWKTPSLGWVQMFLNPDQIKISDKKDIGKVRTKAGYVFQYAGEDLTTISISGTTGSSGIEGINILRAVYRSEQLAFKNIAAELERAGPVAEAAQLAQGFLAGNNFNLGGKQTVAGAYVSASLNVFNQPFPTLSSLASQVEMYFQGELFRGYFLDFSSTETSNEQGMFSYDLTFIAHSRQGIRRNFMPWHRQPFNPIGAAGLDPNPHSFDNGEYYSQGGTEFVSENTNTVPNIVEQGLKKVTSLRSLSSGSGFNGESLENIDLENLL